MNPARFAAAAFAAVSLSCLAQSPIALEVEAPLVKEGENYRTVNVPYYDGLRYPHLERIEGTPDLLSKLLEPR